jgi:hypothetical protein
MKFATLVAIFLVGCVSAEKDVNDCLPAAIAARQIMQKQGESAFALRRGEDFLKTIHVDPALKVRTGRYVSALNSTLSELRKEKSKP